MACAALEVVRSDARTRVEIEANRRAQVRRRACAIEFLSSVTQSVACLPCLDAGRAEPWQMRVAAAPALQRHNHVAEAQRRRRPRETPGGRQPAAAKANGAHAPSSAVGCRVPGAPWRPGPAPTQRLCKY